MITKIVFKTPTSSLNRRAVRVVLPHVLSKSSFVSSLQYLLYIGPIVPIYFSNGPLFQYLFIGHCFNIFLLDHCFNIYCFGRIVPLMTLQKLLQPPSLISTPSNTFYEYCDSKRLQRFVLKYSKPKVCLKPKNKSLKILMKNPCVIHQMRRDSVS